MTFNKNKFLKLLCERKQLKDAGQSLNDFNKEKNSELTTYLILLGDQIFWESTNAYIKILELFVQNKIIFDQFAKQFYNLRASNFEFDEIDIEYNSKSYKFTELISHLQALVEICNPEVNLKENLEAPDQIVYGLSEELLKLRIKNFFLPELKKYL
jgi:hypothetical protein